MTASVEIIKIQPHEQPEWDVELDQRIKDVKEGNVQLITAKRRPCYWRGRISKAKEMF